MVSRLPTTGYETASVEPEAGKAKPHQIPMSGWPTILKLASGRGFFGLARAGISPREKLFDMTEKVVTFGAVAAGARRRRFRFGPTWTGFIQVRLNKSYVDVACSATTRYSRLRILLNGRWRCPTRRSTFVAQSE
jgi:hypothetical protein